MTKAMLHLSEHVNGFGLVLAMPGATALSLYSGCLSLYSFPTHHSPTNQPHNRYSPMHVHWLFSCPTPIFLITAQPAHTPIRQNGSIAPVYILFWTNGQVFLRIRKNHAIFICYSGLVYGLTQEVSWRRGVKIVPTKNCYTFFV